MARKTEHGTSNSKLTKTKSVLIEYVLGAYPNLEEYKGWLELAGDLGYTKTLLLKELTPEINRYKEKEDMFSPSTLCLLCVLDFISNASGHDIEFSLESNVFEIKGSPNDASRNGVSNT